jgi:flagellar hook protein FlgE
MAGSAFYTAASGLRNHQTRIDTIAGNIANVNTHGYKSAQVVFADLLAQTLRGASAPSGNLGGTNPIQVGLGIKIAAIHTNLTQSALENTSRNTDFAVNGAGFFVVKNGEEQLYTRAGDFSLDRDGYMVAASGMRVQGFYELTADGTAIDQNSRIGDISIDFGQKLQAQATTDIAFRSNLDASSFLWGSANTGTANMGSTGILTFSGAAVPYAYTVAPASATVPGAVSDIEINGVTVAYDTTAAASSLAAAQTIANAINSDATLSTQVQATVRNVSGEGYLVISGINAGDQFTIDGTAGGGAVGSGFDAMALTTFTAPTEPGEFLAGSHLITVTDARAATATTTTPVGVGAAAPNPASTFIINGVTYNLDGTGTGITFADTGSSYGNAQIVANIINATAGSEVIAAANTNGTLTLTQRLAGVNNIISINDAALLPVGSLGLQSITDDDAVTPGIQVMNGENARIEDEFSPATGGASIIRFYADNAATGTASSLVNVQSVIVGSTPAFPLIPGITISVDQLAAGQANLTTETATEHTTSRVVFDSLGNAHQLVYKFTHVNNNTWDWEASLPEEPEIVLTNNTGRIEFSTGGFITTANPTNPLEFTPTGADTVRIAMTMDGAGQPLSGITQFSSASTTAINSQNGYSMGVLDDFETDQTGLVVGHYSNGQRRPIAQFVLANFSNAEGLQRVGDSSFRESTNSGSALMLKAGTGGAGLVFGGFLEQSNVDLALEFTNMIITQRGLQANSRVFTTQDEILNEIVNLKR